MSDGHDDRRMLLGGYLVGGLDQADQERMDEHLSRCAACRDELDRLAPVPELLRNRAPVDEAGPPAPVLIEGLLGRMRAERRVRAARRRRLSWVAAAAAVVVAVAAFGAGQLRPDGRASGPIAQPRPSASQPQGIVARFVAAAGAEVTGQATLSARTWGVSVSIEMSGLTGDGPFVLTVSDAGGRTEQACVWGPTPTGNARVTGASSMQLGSVSAVSITDREGRMLATATL